MEAKVNAATSNIDTSRNAILMQDRAGKLDDAPRNLTSPVITILSPLPKKYHKATFPHY